MLKVFKHLSKQSCCHLQGVYCNFSVPDLHKGFQILPKDIHPEDDNYNVCQNTENLQYSKQLIHERTYTSDFSFASFIIM